MPNTPQLGAAPASREERVIAHLFAAGGPYACGCLTVSEDSVIAHTDEASYDDDGELAREEIRIVCTSHGSPIEIAVFRVKLTNRETSEDDD